MGQKTPASSLRVRLNRNFDLCWYQERNSYAQVFFQDFKFRQYFQDICSQTSNAIHYGRIFTSFFPKQYTLSFFSHCASESQKLQGSKLKNQQTTRSNAENIFQHSLSQSLRQTQFGLHSSSQICSSSQHEIKPSLENIEHIGHEYTNCQTNLVLRKSKHFESSAHFFNSILIQSFRQSKSSYRRALQNCISLAQKNPKIQGIRIVCAGRFNGVERARTESRSWGQTSFHTFDALLDYSAKAAATNAGSLGIKVWVLYHADKSE